MKVGAIDLPPAAGPVRRQGRCGRTRTFRAETRSKERPAITCRAVVSIGNFPRFFTQGESMSSLSTDLSRSSSIAANQEAVKVRTKTGRFRSRRGRLAPQPTRSCPRSECCFGYRAMLSHVGSLWRLYEFDLLRQIKRISSVWGGSITSAMLGLRSTAPGAGRRSAIEFIAFEHAGSAAQRVHQRSVSGRITMLADRFRARDGGGWSTARWAVSPRSSQSRAEATTNRHRRADPARSQRPRCDSTSARARTLGSRRGFRPA